MNRSASITGARAQDREREGENIASASTRSFLLTFDDGTSFSPSLPLAFSRSLPSGINEEKNTQDASIPFFFNQGFLFKSNRCNVERKHSFALSFRSFPTRKSLETVIQSGLLLLNMPLITVNLDPTDVRERVLFTRLINRWVRFDSDQVETFIDDDEENRPERRFSWRFHLNSLGRILQGLGLIELLW